MRVDGAGGYCGHMFFGTAKVPSGDVYVRAYVKASKAFTDAQVTFIAMPDPAEGTNKHLRIGGQSKILMYNRELDDAPLTPGHRHLHRSSDRQLAVLRVPPRHRRLHRDLAERQRHRRSHRRAGCQQPQRCPVAEEQHHPQNHCCLLWLGVVRRGHQHLLVRRHCRELDPCGMLGCRLKQSKQARPLLSTQGSSSSTTR
ncbi:hypothetical protein VTK56DRAFT_10221 [Thermocarpiscus australiensis]